MSRELDVLFALAARANINPIDALARISVERRAEEDRLKKLYSEPMCHWRDRQSTIIHA